MNVPMRRKERQAETALGYEILSQAKVAYLAAQTREGSLVQRALNPVLLDDWLLFHGSHAGEKVDLAGQAIVSAHRIVAEIPSYFVDAELACPATTYYQSVEARGELCAIEEPSLKDALLTALMRKYQPEGGYVAIDSKTELYKKQVLATRVFGFKIAQILAKQSIGQDRPTERVQKVVSGLWKRGADGDLPAIEQILGASPNARPLFLSGPGGSHFVTFPNPKLARAHARMLCAEYWRLQSSERDIVQAIMHSSAWLGLVDAEGELLAAGRAVTDSTWTGMICDVVVRQDARGKGLGKALMALLLDHPRVRGVTRLRLGTRDAMEFYARLGFRPLAEVPLAFPHTEMVLKR